MGLNLCSTSRATLAVRTAMLAGAIVGCSGGDPGSEVLHLKDRDITVKDYRAYLKSAEAENEGGFSILCDVIAEHGAQEAVTAIGSLPDRDVRGIKGSTPVPGQEYDSESFEKGVELLAEVCEGNK